MEELRKCYKKLDELMKEIENRHDTDIMDFINLDEEVKAEYMGRLDRERRAGLGVSFEQS